MVNGKRSKSETIESKFQQEPDITGIVGYGERPDVITPNYSRISLSSRPPSSISLDKLPRKKQALAQVCMDGNMLMQNLKVEDKPQTKYKENDWTDLNEETLKAEWNNDEPADLTTHQFYIGVNEKLGSGGSSSDAQEEELVRYFTPGELENGSSQSAENKKISQLREILEKNLKSPSGGPPLGGGAFKRTSLPIREINKSEPSVVMVNPMDSTPNLSNRRRVSFNPITVTDPVSSFSTCPIPPSPGTRRRHFSFQPISPKSGALQSPPASPFVSPRSTPVHMLRSRHSSGSALPVHLLPGTGRNHHLSGCSDVSRAATYGSASESSTPFISPQGTPIPFNRSRHNSAQPRLCRSRHSSGLSLNIQYPARFNTTPYSPGALSNLNNPFSPQPSTPLQGSDQDQIYSQPGHINQFNNTNSEDPRSRHSSAGSEQAPRSAPLSPYSTTPVSGTRVRHQSAGGAIATATIHYRPSWPSNGEYSHNEDVYQTTYTTSQPPVPSPLESSMNTAPSPHHQVMHASPSPHHQGLHNQSTLQQIHNQPYSYQVESLSHSVTNSYRTQNLDSEFGGDNEDLDLLDLQEGLEGEDEGKGRKDGDELDLALSALRDCDTDFSKFLPEVENSTNH
ncbi:uncharacterized protein LOC111715775 [Eurytemora carolleeae]|uniref:uncharacterized protein LOC111715775 n=1 Tax=Eurytemora carolleeae TaxID=1294199 RepID=UPI000C789DC1|nr:uncharacterized protein LOC111715775 [Eurytemora carolleeae]|eukprot:XP_023346910.1 uncharacterized protein LOC111715775 [Eurytemora affinis]